MRLHRRLHTTVAASVLASLTLVGAPALVAPAGATTPKVPQYKLNVTEGSTNVPEFQHPNMVDAEVENVSTEVVLEVVHAGVVVGQDSGHGGEGAYISPGPQVGDELVFEAPKGNLIARFAYDGLPTMDATVCAGSPNFSGANSPGFTVEGKVVTKTIVAPYHHSPYVHESGFSEAQVKSLSGTTFGGAFIAPLTSSETVTAIESLKTPLPGEATFTYTSTTERPVGACPAPPVVPPPPPPPIFSGSIAKLFSSKIGSFLKSGARDQVSITVPGTVTQDLYLVGGKLPATAASNKHKRQPPALLLARGSATASAPGKVTVQLRLTNKGRQKLKGAHRLKTVLITTLRSTTGAKITLGRRSITLHR
jgi:hypothetical protein